MSKVILLDFFCIHHSLFQPVQIVVNCFNRQGTSLAFQKLYDRVGRKSFAYIFDDIANNTAKQIKIRYVVPLYNIACYDRAINPFHNLIGRMLVKIAECDNGETAHTDILIQKFSWLLPRQVG